MRLLGRTNLEWLCHELLNYRDITREVHGRLLTSLEVFDNIQGVDHIDHLGNCLYLPIRQSLSLALPLSVKRRYLILMQRGGMKTTLNVHAHSIQILLNFPHEAIQIYHAAEGKAAEIAEEIMWPFENKDGQYDAFQAIYSEYCFKNDRQKKLLSSSSGKKYAFHFTVPARSIVPTPRGDSLPKEPSIAANALTKSQGGLHVGIIKFTDIVGRENSRTAKAVKNVIDDLDTALNLLRDPHCLAYIEGTNYHSEDAYLNIIEQHWIQFRSKNWSMLVQPAYKKINPRTGEYDYTPDCLDMPYARAKEDIVWAPGVVTKKGQRIPDFPFWRIDRPKFDNDSLEEKERGNPGVFAMQQLLNPAESEENNEFNPRTCYQRIPHYHLESMVLSQKLLLVDTAEMREASSNSTSMMRVGVGINEAAFVFPGGFLGKLNPDELVSILFDQNRTWNPDAIYLEETSFVRGLKPHIESEEMRQHIRLPIIFLKPSTQRSKQDRIRASLHRPLSQGTLKFSSDLELHISERIRREMLGFPLSAKDDVLDSLSLLYHPKVWDGTGERKVIGASGTTDYMQVWEAFLFGPKDVSDDAEAYLFSDNEYFERDLVGREGDFF